MSNQDVVSLVLRFTLSVALTYMSWRLIKEVLEPNRKERQAAEKRTKELLKRLGLSEKIALTEHEMFVATNLVEPSSVSTDWDDIGGLDSTITELRRTVLMPLRRSKDVRISALVQPPKGVLLYGPPGCGKTMLAKALAKEADARFINLQLSTLTDKWYGESQKLAAAVFSLAEKIQPALVFIDEIDAFLRVRDRGDHEVTAMMKAQFLSLWDGLTSDPSCRIVVLGATNRPQDVDDAIKRRLPCTFHIGFPDLKQRRAILGKMLAKEQLANDVNLDLLAENTPTYSGADLQEFCRKAAVRCYNRFAPDFENIVDQLNSRPNDECDAEVVEITMDDFNYALGVGTSGAQLILMHQLAALTGKS